MTLRELIESLEEFTEGQDGLNRENMKVFFEGNSVEDFEVGKILIGFTTIWAEDPPKQEKVILLRSVR